MPQPYLSSTVVKRVEPVIYSNARLSGLLARCVMAVDPDFVMVTPTPMARPPNPVNVTDVVARSTAVIRPVTDHDVHNDSICH